jgi:trimethyllysine dioxygenase
LEVDTNISASTLSSLIAAVRTSPTRKFVTIEFHDATFTFHAQWLHDAQMDDGPYKKTADTYTHKHSDVEIQNANASGHGINSAVEISWNDGRTTRFPSIWLRVYAPLVAKHHGDNTAQKDLQIPKGWLASTLAMLEISYTEIFPEVSDRAALRIYETLVHDSFPGILKITNLPPPIVENERKGQNTLVAKVLMQIFDSVFAHPRRGPDIAYTIASLHDKKGMHLPNYDTSQLLLPHVDQSFYQDPTRIDGLYNLEGESENTFVSCPAVLQTLKEESPELVEPLFTAPMAIGRVAHMYSPAQYQGATSTVITPLPGFPHQIYRFRWHPHLVGSLLAPFSQFPAARLAHRKFQEIASRDTHRLKVRFMPGDMYLFDNFRVLHGRERVLKGPRTTVGQSVPEQVMVDRWREMLIGRLIRVLEEKWLIHVPLAQLYELDKIVNGLET